MQIRKAKKLAPSTSFLRDIIAEDVRTGKFGDGVDSDAVSA